MTRQQELKEEIERVRQILDEASLGGISDQEFYELNIRLDELIACYIENNNK